MQTHPFPPWPPCEADVISACLSCGARANRRAESAQRELPSTFDSMRGVDRPLTMDTGFPWVPRECDIPPGGSRALGKTSGGDTMARDRADSHAARAARDVA